MLGGCIKVLDYVLGLELTDIGFLAPVAMALVLILADSVSGRIARCSPPPLSIGITNRLFMQ